MVVSKRRTIGIGIVLLAVAGASVGGYFAYKHFKKPKTVVVPAVSSETRKGLQAGTCSDDNLAGLKKIQDAAEKSNDFLKKVNAYRDTGSCYQARKDYANAIAVDTKLADTYKQSNFPDLEKQERDVITNLKYLQSIPSESHKEVHTDEPLSN